MASRVGNVPNDEMKRFSIQAHLKMDLFKQAPTFVKPKIFKKWKTKYSLGSLSKGLSLAAEEFQIISNYSEHHI